MLNEECVENAPKEQSRLDHEMAVFRCNAWRAGLSFFCFNQGWWISMSLVFLFGGRATMSGGGVSSAANLCLRFFFRCDSDEFASAWFQLDRHRLNRHQKLNSSNESDRTRCQSRYSIMLIKNSNCQSQQWWSNRKLIGNLEMSTCLSHKKEYQNWRPWPRATLSNLDLSLPNDTLDDQGVQDELTHLIEIGKPDRTYCAPRRRYTSLIVKITILAFSKGCFVWENANTTPNPRIRRTPAHVIFSRVAQDLSHRVNRNRCVSRNSHSSHLQQHIARALVVVSSTLEHYTIFDMHSSPTFYHTIYQTFIVVYFTMKYVSFGLMAETNSVTGYDPKDLTEEDNSILVKPMFFHRPSMTSTCDSAESIATSPPESYWDNDQIQNMLGSPLYLQEGEPSADRSRVYHSLRENSVSSSSHFEMAQGSLLQCSHIKKSSQGIRSNREGISSRHQPVQGKDEILSGFSDTEEAARLIRSWRTKRSSTRRSEIWSVEARM